MINQHYDSAIRIGLIDDHVLLREALANVIGTFEDCKVNLCANNGFEMIEKLHGAVRPDVIIMDINMPVMDGYESAAWLKENFPDVHIIVLTMYDSEMALLRLLKSGVKAFLKKDTLPRELHHAIQSVITNGYYYPFNALGRLANGFRNSGPQYAAQTIVLSENELTFLKFSSTEMTYKEIARKMYISPRTIDNYRDALFNKLDIKSRVGLAMYAIKNGIVTF